MIEITETIVIAVNEFEKHFIRPPGPGGQNVNTVETAVQLRFDAAGSPALAPEVLRRLRTLAGQRMTLNGVVIISASRYRSQERNRGDAIDRLVSLLQRAVERPSVRVPSRPTRGMVKQRLDEKRRRSATKRTRGRPAAED